MKNYRIFQLFICLIALLSTLSLAGCTAVETVEPPTQITGREIKIATGTQGQVGRLAIGLGDTGKADYDDNAGKTLTRLVATLALYLGGNPPVQKRVVVYAGETVEFKNYTLYVMEISAGGIALLPGASTGHVTLMVREPEEPGPSVQP